MITGHFCRSQKIKFVFRPFWTTMSNKMNQSETSNIKDMSLKITSFTSPCPKTQNDSWSKPSVNFFPLMEAAISLSSNLLPA